MSDVTLEDLAVHQLCAFAARRKAFVRLADVASAGGRKRNNDFAPLRNIFNEWLVRDTSKKIKVEGALRKMVADGELKREGAGKLTCYIHLK